MREKNNDSPIDNMEPYDDNDFEDMDPDDEMDGFEEEEQSEEEEAKKANPLGISIPENWQVFLYRLAATTLTLGAWIVLLVSIPTDTGWFPVVLLGLVVTAIAVKVLMFFGSVNLLSEFKALMVEVKEKKQNNANSADDE